MKSISEQDHYEILEIERDATPDEIERSFRMAQATYGPDSLAGYSVFGEGEVQAIRERIGLAHRVLSDPESRSAYDASLGRRGAPRSAFAEPPAGRASASRDMAEAMPRGKDLGDPLPMQDLDTLEDEGDEFDGARLRRSRLHRGIEIEEIANRTKISPAYLRFIEEDRYADLPAPVYVRGFVSAYADCVGLDPKRVAASYMKHFDQPAASSRRGRFRTGR